MHALCSAVIVTSLFFAAVLVKDQDEALAYRAPPDLIDRINDVLKLFQGRSQLCDDSDDDGVASLRHDCDDDVVLTSVLAASAGTRNYHNFTSGKAPNEASAKRFITGFRAAGLTVINGREYVALHVDGQSFMIHQVPQMSPSSSSPAMHSMSRQTVTVPSADPEDGGSRYFPHTLPRPCSFGLGGSFW